VQLIKDQLQADTKTHYQIRTGLIWEDNREFSFIIITAIIIIIIIKYTYFNVSFYLRNAWTMLKWDRG